MYKFKGKQKALRRKTEVKAEKRKIKAKRLFNQIPSNKTLRCRNDEFIVPFDSAQDDIRLKAERPKLKAKAVINIKS